MRTSEAKAQLKSEFIHELAVYLVGTQASRSIQLQLGDDDARQWAKLRGKTPVFGYPTVEEAEEVLREFLS